MACPGEELGGSTWDLLSPLSSRLPCVLLQVLDSEGFREGSSQDESAA